MKKSEITKKINAINTVLDLEQYEKMRRIEMEMTVESREGDRNRARSDNSWNSLLVEQLK
jgi:hypothetical protein